MTLLYQDLGDGSQLLLGFQQLQSVLALASCLFLQSQVL